MTKQITNNIIMVRPSNFGYNEQTAVNNSFQTKDDSMLPSKIASKAIKEFNDFAKQLESKGIVVSVFDDIPDHKTPDAVFPNNWITTHENGMVISYPMFAPIRRLERRSDIIDMIKEKYQVEKDYTFEYYEEKDLFLEGTGSLILDRPNRIVYAAISPRTSIAILDKWCILLDYRKIHFNAVDRNGDAIYHTNVMMALGEDFVVICLDSIRNEHERSELETVFAATGKEIINISYDQMESFAGNMIQLQSVDGQKYLVMSKSAHESLTNKQIEQIHKYSQIIVGNIPTIEKFGGGSVRCMIAENFLSPKHNE